jgi:DNA-binding MarR family transcriptional regulator
MGDEKKIEYRSDNVYGLMQDLTERIADRMTELRSKTPFADVWPSDAKTFMLISRHPRTISDLARALKISRQATHRSVMRLVERGGVELVPAPGSNRDKIAIVTELGKKARSMAAKNNQIVEAEMAEKIGADKVEELRAILKKLQQ